VRTSNPIVRSHQARASRTVVRSFIATTPELSR
jgi:hypothetical protein